MEKVLLERKFNVKVVENLEEAKKLVLLLIPKESTVSVGGSETLNSMNMVETLRNGPYKFYDRYQKLPFEPDIVNIYRESLTSDILITSVNAVTEKGEIVCSDSSGNRVAGITFGAKKVIIVVGINKLVKDLDAAFERIKEIEPMNAKKNGHRTKSAETGFYTDEISDQRMLNVTGIMHYGGKFKDRLNIIVVKEEVGF